MAEESYYELLQVTPTADLEIITAAYRALIRRHHPDRNPSPSADATTKLLNEAWEVLSDPAKRAEYDRTFAGGSSSRPAPPPRPPNRPTQETRPPRPKPPPPPPRASEPPGLLKGAWDDLGVLTLVVILAIIASFILVAMFVWAANTA